MGDKFFILKLKKIERKKLFILLFFNFFLSKCKDKLNNKIKLSNMSFEII